MQSKLKLIKLSLTGIEALTIKAAKKGMVLKPYIESVLEAHAIEKECQGKVK